MSEKFPLHPATEYLVVRGMAAVRDKLARAEQKYGYRDGWLSPNWMGECRAKMYHHITKGDPLDVIAYCLFLWHHGAPTCRPRFHVELLDQFDVVLDRRDLRDFARSAIEHALREPQYDGADMSSTWYLEESTRRADEFIEKFANRIQPFDEVASTISERPPELADRIKALFVPNPPGELGPSDEPESQYRYGYNTALEDVLAALESPAAASMARATHAREYVGDCKAGDASAKCMCSGLGPCEKHSDGSCRLEQRDVIEPLKEPVSIKKAMRAGEIARVGGTDKSTTAFLVNIQIAPWGHPRAWVDGCCYGFNLGAKWMQAAMRDAPADAEVNRAPSGYAYRYPYIGDRTVIRFNDGSEVNGSRPLESIPYWFDAPPVAEAESATDGRPRDCSGDVASCPDNEGRGCWCSNIARAGEKE